MSAIGSFIIPLSLLTSWIWQCPEFHRSSPSHATSLWQYQTDEKHCEAAPSKNNDYETNPATVAREFLQANKSGVSYRRIGFAFKRRLFQIGAHDAQFNYQRLAFVVSVNNGFFRHDYSFAFFFQRNGNPKASNSSLASSSVLAVVLMVTSKPRMTSIFSY